MVSKRCSRLLLGTFPESKRGHAGTELETIPIELGHLDLKRD